jgi:DNA processing protein
MVAGLVQMAFSHVLPALFRSWAAVFGNRVRHAEPVMTIDQVMALSLLEDLPRCGLTDRLRAADPELAELAAPLVSRARELEASASASNIFFLPWNDPRYPAGLLAISDCPPGLWYRGSLDCFADPAVAVVGSRAGSAVALEMAEQLGEELAGLGITVVSGLARGVDSAAHRGALRAGRTVAVLGSGLNHVYPSEHADLAGEIARSGVVVSEYPPEAPPLPFHFPLRNRIISGLSRAVVVIEASEKSGSLITAMCALEQGREVMAVPGNALSGRNRGGHALIRDGAKIVERADDIVGELRLGGCLRQAPGASASGCSRTCSVDPLLSRMEPGQAYDLDALAAASGVGVSRLLTRLSDLELEGRVRRLDGGRFMRTS